MKNLRSQIFAPLAAALLCLALPVLAYPKPLDPPTPLDSQSDATAAQQPGDASASGQTGAQTGNNQPGGDQWTTDEARRAYQAGYDAGLQAASSNAQAAASAPAMASPSSAPAMASDTRSDAGRFGYDDGLAAGRADRNTGHSFRPTDGGSYKKADRGWTPDFGDKQHYRQLYRQSYAEGYENGYNPGTPR